METINITVIFDNILRHTLEHVHDVSAAIKIITNDALVSNVSAETRIIAAFYLCTFAPLSYVKRFCWLYDVDIRTKTCFEFRKRLKELGNFEVVDWLNT
jgi:hypothetical protein